MLTESMDWEFGQGTAGMACLCSILAGVSAGRFECLGEEIIWRHLAPGVG